MLDDTLIYPAVDNYIALSTNGRAALNDPDNGLETHQRQMLHLLQQQGVLSVPDWLRALHDLGIRGLVTETASLLKHKHIQSLSLPISGQWAEDLDSCLAQISGRGAAVLADLQGLLISSHNIEQNCAELLAGAAAEMAIVANKYKKLSPPNDDFLSITLNQAQQGSCFYQILLRDQQFVLALTGANPTADMTSALHQQLMTLLWILKQRYEVKEANLCVKK